MVQIVQIIKFLNVSWKVLEVDNAAVEENFWNSHENILFRFVFEPWNGWFLECINWLSITVPEKEKKRDEDCQEGNCAFL